MREKLIGISAAGALAVACFAQGPPSSDGQPPASVVVDQARRQAIEPRREVTGELRAVRRSIVAAEEAGRVAELLVDEGDSVEAGQPLAKLDATRRRIDVRRAEANVNAASSAVAEREAGLEQAQRDLDHLRELRRNNSATEKEVDDARTAVEQARAALEQARAEARSAQVQLDEAGQRLEDMTVEAPFDGRIVRLETELGQWISAGGAVVEMVKLDPIEAWLDVPESLLARLSGWSGSPSRAPMGIGQGGDGAEQGPAPPVQVRVRATGRVLEGPVHTIVPQVDRLSRLFPVVVRLDNADGALRPGMSIVGLAPTGRSEQRLTVHKDGVLRDQAGSFVFFIRDGVAEVARVEPKFAVGDRLVVESAGLQAGAEVIVEGNERLSPGRPVAIDSRFDAEERTAADAGGGD